MMKKINPFYWYGAGFCLLVVLFMAVYFVSMPTKSGAALFEYESSDLVKLLNGADSYTVADAFKNDSSPLPAHDFPELQAAKSKINRGLLVTLKQQAHVLEQYDVPDNSKLLYFTQRTHTEEQHTWTQVDMLAVDPRQPSLQTDPIGYTYGVSAEQVGKATRLCGFVSKDEFLYTTIKNENEELVYRVNRFSLTKRTATPVLELYRFRETEEKLPAILAAAVSPDGRQLLVRDERSGIASYDLKTGVRNILVPAPGEQDSAATFLLSSMAGIGLYSPGRFQSSVRLIDFNTTATVKQPFASEAGLIDAGLDANRKVIYYNFTYDPSAQNIATGEKKAMLNPYGVQITDLKGNPLKRFSLPKDSAERLEYGGYSEDKKAVLLHKFTVALNGQGQPYKKTSGWLLGDMNTGAMTALQTTDVPDGWDRKDVLFGSVFTEANNETAAQQVFVNSPDNTYFITRWKTKEAVLLPDEDLVMFADEMSKRVFVSSLTRPDLIVAVNNYKKYNWDNREFAWLNGHWMSRYHSQPDGDKLYFFQIN